MCLIDRPEARESIVVRIHAEAEWTIVPFRLGAPVILVVIETVHLLFRAFQLHFQLLVSLSLLFLLSLLFEFTACFLNDFLFDGWIVAEWKERRRNVN